MYLERNRFNSLLIPFGEYESAGATDPISGSCMGYALIVDQDRSRVFDLER